MEDREKELRDLMREERSRGRKRVDIEGEREQKLRHAELLETARYGTEQRFRELLREYGFSEEKIEEKVEEKIEEKVKVFRAFRAGL